MGSDPRLRNEYIIFSAHWDALGRDTSLKGDQILNGAIDNAFGVAQMLEIAEAFKKLPRPPKRTIIFIGTTAEEDGFLGAHFYAQNPLYPLENTLANVNLDMSFAYGLTSDVINFGYGSSELDDILKEVAATQAHTITPDLWPTEGFYFRMDHYEFANVGVPSISPWMGINVIGKPPGFGKKKVDEYFKHNYHQPSDEVSADWDYTGAIQHTQICFLVGLKVAEADQWPKWKHDSMFKTRRDDMLTHKINDK
jgi:Zn-dependent M28 family amino/carboxypeptidase